MPEDWEAPFMLKLACSYILGGIVAYIVLLLDADDPKYGGKFVVLTIVFSLFWLIPLRKVNFYSVARVMETLTINVVLTCMAFITSAVLAAIGTLLLHFAFDAFNLAIPTPVVFLVIWALLMWLFIADMVRPT